MDLPLTIVPEVQEAITSHNKDVINSERQITKVETDDARSDEETNRSISRLQTEREVIKRRNKQAITSSKVGVEKSNKEIARLQKFVKKFS